jgi:antitoxin component YwqK of YwqJK toxin-antitoxin module
MLIILIFTLHACSSPPKKQTNEDSKNQMESELSSSENKNLNIDNTSLEREYIDSANFHIIRGNYKSGSKYIEVYENKSTKLDNWKEYYENGQLKEVGLMTYSNHILVGIWKYYSKNGKIDSIVDYDKKYPVSYFEALKIAEKKGFKMPEIEVTLQVDNTTTFWQIARWTDNENHSGQNAEVIFIDTKTGKVKKPKYQLGSIY